MMKRDQCLKVLARHRTDEIVVAVYQAAQEWLHISPSDLNYDTGGEFVADPTGRFLDDVRATIAIGSLP